MDSNPGLGGQLPDSYSQWQSLVYFSASSGQLNGTLPASWATNLTSLEVLDLSGNVLTGR